MEDSKEIEVISICIIIILYFVINFILWIKKLKWYNKEIYRVAKIKGLIVEEVKRESLDGPKRDFIIKDPESFLYQIKRFTIMSDHIPHLENIINFIENYEKVNNDFDDNYVNGEYYS